LVTCVCRELLREKAWSRIHLVPLLLAEGDRDTYRREQAALAREKEIMKDVEGWEVCIPLTFESLMYSGFLPSYQVGRSAFNNTRYRGEDSIVVL